MSSSSSSSSSRRGSSSSSSGSGGGGSSGSCGSARGGTSSSGTSGGSGGSGGGGGNGSASESDTGSGGGGVCGALTLTLTLILAVTLNITHPRLTQTFVFEFFHRPKRYSFDMDKREADVIDLTSTTPKIPLRRASRRGRSTKQSVVIDLTDDNHDTSPTPKHPKTNTQHTTGYWQTTLLYDDGFGGLAFGESFFVNA